MTPIIDLQRRLREAGRIRIGEKVRGNDGKARPGKLTEFRFTSADERAIRAIADLYGGEVQRWDAAPVGEQWEVYTDAKALDVVVPPVDLAFSQWMELWSGGGCARRCDGQTNVITDTPCVCDPDVPTCKPTTRLGVILTALEGIGVWRVELHGWNGAQELLGAIEVLRTMQSRGNMVPARLLLEQRQSKRDGKTFNYPVPVLDLNFNIAAVMGGQDVEHIKPIARAATNVPSLQEQLAAVDNPERLRAPARARAAAALPKTGLAPRTVAAAEALPASRVQPAEVVAISAPAVTNQSVELRRLNAMMNGNTFIGQDEPTRLAWATAYLGRQVADFATLNAEELATLTQLLKGGHIASAASVTNPQAVTSAAPQYTPTDTERPF